MPEVMVHDFLLGLMKIYILHFADKEDLYGKDFHDRMLTMGFDVSYGTIYPLFHKMEERGYLTCSERNVKGKIRKYYAITNKGREALASAKARVHEVVEVLDC
jgi:DNA-binding PadR family transcriptional regulator